MRSVCTWWSSMAAPPSVTSAACATAASMALPAASTSRRATATASMSTPVLATYLLRSLRGRCGPRRYCPSDHRAVGMSTV